METGTTVRYWVFSLLILCGWPVQAQIIISEVYYDAIGTDSGLVFVELAGTPGTSLDGLELIGINGSNGSTYKTVPLAGLMPADEVFVIGDDDGNGLTSVPNVDLIADVDFQNGPDSIFLWDGNMILDAIGYGDFESAIFAGEGLPALDAPAGKSLARWLSFGDTDNNAVDFIVLDIPTPGVAAMVAVPVPGAFWLFGSGLLVAGIRRVQCK